MARFVSFASVISELQQSDMFMTVKARILETPKANLNGARVTPAFVDEIISNEERYIGLPLYADVKALTSGKYNRLGHLYDTRTGEFHSTQIGSFYEFAKEDFDGGSYLIGYARIPKRNKKLSKAIAELFANGSLKFSFEISCGEYTELDDGTIEIDASENNFLEGTAIVTFPACEDAVALEFVAQREAEVSVDDTNGGETEMAEKEEKVVETPVENAEVQPEAAEAEIAEAVETPEEETAEVSENKENASVVVREEHYESDTVSAYDTETGTEVRQTVSVETVAIEQQEGEIIQDTDGAHVAETKIADDPAPEVPQADPEEPAEASVEEVTACDQTPDDEKPKKKTAEEMIAELEEMISKQAETIKTLAEQVESMKQAHEEKRAIASAEHAEAPNPFIAEINATGKYSLLESFSASGSSLLEP